MDSDGGVSEIEYEEPIDNSGSLVLGFVDDLGTRSTIYLYNNTDQITTGTITITMPDDDTTKKNITAIADTTTISSDSNYITYTVTENGTYTFKATNGTTETETKIRVKNIETFKKVDDMGLSYVNSENKAYSYKGAAVPKGYYVDTKSNVSTGLVITDDINKNGYSTGNEWVWVPVNSTVGNSDFYEADETDTMAGNDEDTNKLKYGNFSLLYDFITNATTKLTTRTAKTKTKPSATGGYREIAILTNSTYGEQASLNTNPIYSRATAKNATPTALASEKAIAEQYIADYNSMVKSVTKYGGFYIGRYEITENGEKPGTSLTNTNWYSFYNKCMTLNKENAETSMIYGTLWDATMQWLSPNYVVGKGSTKSEYGNYETEAVSVNNDDTKIIVKAGGTIKKLQTGQTSYTKSNNIYDLSGNCYDWTQEAKNDDLRVLRGGTYFLIYVPYNDNTYSASRGGSNPTNSNDYYSSRPQLYIK